VGITISYTWASTGLGSAQDQTAGITSYTDQSDTATTVTASGLSNSILKLFETTAAGSGVGNTSNGNSGTGCVDASFSAQTSGSSMVEPGCVDSSAIEAASGNHDGALLSQSFTSANASAYAFFQGSATPNNLDFIGTASTNDSFAGGPYGNAYQAGKASETITVQYTYNPYTSLPEPATLFLMGSALVGVGLIRKRAKR